MTLWIVADAHGGANADADAELLALLDAAIVARVDVLVLGDLFAVWLAMDEFLTPFQRSVIARFRHMMKREQTVRFVVGNRDYLVREGQLHKSFDEVIEDSADILIGTKITRVMHGDRINPDDLWYQRWHRLTRNGIARRLMRAAPSMMAQRISMRLERKLAGTNQSYKSGALPTAHLEALSRSAARAGVDQVLLGHFHADTTVRADDGVDVIIAPAWLDQRRILIAEGDTLISVNPLQT